ALARMRAELAAQGLLRVLPPRRTRAARRLVAELRERRPLPEGPDGLPEDEALLAVALYGERALTVLAPRFAREAGLTGRGALADEGRFPFGRGTSLRHIVGDEGRYDGWDGGHDHGGHHYGGGHDHGGGFGGGGGFD
ncbi:TIGR04222 domain-containing membrane protein, partial [Streptomyces sp. NPDC004658]